MLFLGQAANYRGGAAWRHIFACGTARNSRTLREYLANHYGAASIEQVALTANGRSAIAIALKASVPKDSKVLINGFTCQAVLQAVKAAGCVPIYADIDTDTLHFSANHVKELIKKHPDIKAIIIQNTLGIPVDITAIKKTAKECIIIEDLAHCTGVNYADGKEVGTVGDATALSFGKGKSIDTISGGAVIMRNPHLPPIKQPTHRQKLSDTLRARWYPLFGALARGPFRSISKVWLGGLIKIHWIERSADAKLDVSARLTHWQAKLALKELQKLPKKGRGPIRGHYLVNDREDLLKELKDHGFNFEEIWYDVPVSPARNYNKVHFPEDECPNATKIAAQIVNTPTNYTATELKPAIKIIKKYEITPEKPATTLSEKWQATLTKYADVANFAQSPAWKDMNERIGHKVVVKAIDDGVAMMIIKNAKRGRYMEIPCGPLINWQDKKQVESTINTIKNVAKANRCAFIRLRPQLEDTPKNRELLTKLGAKVAPMHLAAEHTVILDLTKTEDELLAEMRRQTRYEVRRSIKMGITVEHDNSVKLFEEFHKIQADTAARQHFIPPDLNTLMAEREAFADNAEIYVAKTAEGEPIAYGLVLISGEEGEYFEAASTDLNRKLPGAYALQWQVMRDLKAKGIKRYNLWGIAPPNQPHHRYAGVTTFKTGFGGKVVEFVPAHDIVISKVKYLPAHLVESIRKKRRHL